MATPGIVCLSHTARPSCSETIHLLLPGGEDHFRYRQKRLWQKHTESVVNAILRPNIG